MHGVLFDAPEKVRREPALQGFCNVLAESLQELGTDLCGMCWVLRGEASRIGGRVSSVDAVRVAENFAELVRNG